MKAGSLWSIGNVYFYKENNLEKAVNAYKQWGFKDINKAKLNVLNE